MTYSANLKSLVHSPRGWVLDLRRLGKPAGLRKSPAGELGSLMECTLRKPVEVSGQIGEDSRVAGARSQPRTLWGIEPVT